MRKQPLEWSYLEAIEKIIHRPHDNIRVGWGDDAFVFRNFPGYSVLCQDMLVENVHFDLDYFSAKDLGHKALAVNLSDLAAMGARPHFIHVSLGLPKKINQSWLDDFYKSMSALADQWQCQIVGGDLTQSPDRLIIDVNVHGSLQQEPLQIQLGQKSDLILASGPLGLSRIGLWGLQNKMTDFEKSKSAHLRPTARLDLVQSLQEKKDFIKGLTDCSDGFLQDVQSFLPQNLGVKIIASNWTLDPELLQYETLTGQSALKQSLLGGEDFELLLLIEAGNLQHFPGWQILAEIIEGPSFILSENNEHKELPLDESFVHFNVSK